MSYIHKRKEAFRCAFRGVWMLFRDEAHAKIHAAATVLVIAAGFLFHIARWEWCAVLICIGTVIMAEAVNTAIERVCDKVCTERNPLIGQAKDIAAGAVLVLAIISVVIAAIIFIPKIAAML